RPFDSTGRLPRNARSEWEHGGAQALRSNKGSPRTDVEAEKRANDDPVLGSNSRRPHDARVCVGYAVPVVASDTEHNGTSCSPTGAVNARNLFHLNAQHVPKRRISFLSNTHLRLLNDRESRQIIQRP